MDGVINNGNDEIDGQMQGGRRHRSSKKRHGNASLRAWVKFVKKVQREEKISYKEAMMRAKKRKDSGEKWRGGALVGGALIGGEDDNEDFISDDEAAVVNDEVNLDLDEAVLDDDMEGGRRRRRTRRHKSRKHVRKSRKHGRKSRRHR
jgi:hypothetical protein